MSSKEFEMFASQADRLATQGRLGEAIDMYQRALQIEPQNANVRRNIININMKDGRYADAVREYLEWARACQERGFIDDAFNVYQELINLESQAAKKNFLMGQRGASVDDIKKLISDVKVDVYYNMGVILQAKGHLDDSIEYLKSALEIAPTESTARIHMVLGQAYMKKGMDKEAVGAFQEVVRLAPSEAAYAYEMLGEIYIRGGRTPQGTIVWFRNAGDLYIKNNQLLDTIRVFERILNFEPRNKDILARLGEIYAQKGQMEEAVETFLKLAKIYTEEGLLDKVVVLYEKLSEWLPENGEIRKSLISIYRDMLGVDAGNLSVRHKLIGILLNDGSAEEAIPEFLSLASIYLEKGMSKEGLSVIQKMLDIDPNNLKANEILGEIYYRQGRSDMALDQYLHVVKILREKGDEEGANRLNKELVKKFPQQIDLYYQQAIEERERGNFDSAIKILDGIIRDNPSYKQAMFTKADIMVKMNKWEQAYEVYQRILQLEPHHIEVRKILLEHYIGEAQLDRALAETNSIAEQLFNKGDYKEVETLYRRLLAFMPDNIDIRERLCDVQAARGHMEKAVNGYLIVFNIYRRMEIYDGALRMCNKIMELSPGNVLAQRTLASFYGQFNPAEALTRYAALVQFYLARTLDSAAADIIQEILVIQPDNRDYRQQLISIFVKQLKFEEATDHYRILLVDYLKSGDIEKAQETVREIIALQSFNLEMRREISEIYLEYGLVKEAMELLEELIHLYEDKGETEKVIDLNRQMSELALRIEQRFLSWDYSIKVAELLYGNGKRDEAVQEYLTVLEQMLERGDIERERILFPRMEEIFFKEDMVDSGIESLERIVSSLYEAEYIDRALILQEQIEKVYERKGDSEKARQLLNTLADKYEEIENYPESLRLKEALSLLYTGEEHVEDLIHVYFSIIELLLKQGMSSAACEYFERINELRPDNREYLLQISNMLFEAGAPEKSQPMLERILQLDPESYDAMSKLVIVHAGKGEMSEAIFYARRIIARGLLGSVLKAYRSIVMENEGDAGAHLSMGRFYEEMGFFEEAVFEYKKAASDSESRLLSLNTIGKVFLRQNFVSLAIKQFQKILDMGYPDEEQLDTRYNLAQAYVNADRLEDALIMYQECYAIDIRFRDVAEKISEISAKLASA